MTRLSTLLSLFFSLYARPTLTMPFDGTNSLNTRCGTFLAPDSMFLLKENNPDAYVPVQNSLFQVSQQAGIYGGRATGRQYILVHFPPTPYGSYGCELHWNIPQATQFISYYGSHQLDVKTTTAYYPPFRPTWNTVIAGNPPTLGAGVFGTVNVASGVNSAINTATCSNRAPTGQVGGGFGLGFVFKFSDWVEQAGNTAGASFKYGGAAGSFTGPYINYNC